MPARTTRTIGIIRLDGKGAELRGANELDNLAATLRRLAGEPPVRRRLLAPPAPATARLREITADLATIRAQLDDQYQQLTV